MKIGIIGNGFVGQATKELECDEIEILSYDLNPVLCNPIGTTLNDVLQTDIIFISVPTPMDKDGSCSLIYITKVIDDITQYINFDEKLVVIRSTVPPGTSKKYNCYFMPEFLTEKNFKYDFTHNENWIFGIKNKPQDIIFKETVKELLNTSFKHNKIFNTNTHFVSNSEAEMIKLFRNNFLALKVSFCNEMEEFCKYTDINYKNVRRLSVLDPRVGSDHTYVPGHDGKRGYGGTCFPKDSNSCYFEMKRSGMVSYIVKSMVERNEIVDRPDKDWYEKGRSVV
jgi:nucleotide sugar dehydrogenase